MELFPRPSLEVMVGHAFLGIHFCHKLDRAYLGHAVLDCFTFQGGRTARFGHAKHILDVAWYTPSTSWTCRFGTFFRSGVDARDVSHMPFSI